MNDLDVLLLNSPLFEESNQDYDGNVVPPLGLAYIASNLKDNSISCDLIDAVYEKMGVEDICDYFQNTNPKFIGINIFTTNMELVKKIVEKCPIYTTFIIGGQAAKDLYNEIFAWKTQNKIIIIIGEADLLFSSLIRNIDDKIEPDKKYLNPPRELYKIELTSIYFPNDISKLKIHREFLKSEPIKNKFGYNEAFIIASRGCKYSCAFCAAARNLNKNIPIRYRSAQSIKDEINEIKSLYNGNVDAIRILDDLFLRDNQSIMLAKEIFENSGLTWRSMAHTLSFKQTDINVLKELKKSGCTELFIGVESGSENMLKRINKFHNIPEIKKTFEKIFKAGINIKAYFIYGFPYEAIEDINDTYELASSLRDIAKSYGTRFRASAFKFRLYHGTKIYNDILKYNNNSIKIKMEHDNALSVPERSLFDFTSGNYSNVSDYCLTEFIEKTNRLKSN